MCVPVCLDLHECAYVCVCVCVWTLLSHLDNQHETSVSGWTHPRPWVWEELPSSVTVGASILVSVPLEEGTGGTVDKAALLLASAEAWRLESLGAFRAPGGVEC